MTGRPRRTERPLPFRHRLDTEFLCGVSSLFHFWQVQTLDIPVTRLAVIQEKTTISGFRRGFDLCWSDRCKLYVWMAHNDFHGVYNQDVDRPSYAAGGKLADTSTGQPTLPRSGRDSASGEQRCNIKMEPSEGTSEVSYTSARLRVGKRKLDAEVSSSVSRPPASSDDTIQYEAPSGAGISMERAPEEADKLLALFLELRGIAKAAVRDTGLGFYFSAYGYGTTSERQDIMPQIEQELHECSMLKLVQFFRYFLCCKQVI